MAQPRVAVVGGGIAGTLCSLVLKHRGIEPILIDAGRSGMGGRLRNGGAQFLRAADPRLATVVGMLEQKGFLQEWKGRFGMLGSTGGGFLPAETITKNNDFKPREGSEEQQQDSSSSETAAAAGKTLLKASDGGDFCRFVEGSTAPTYMGMPSMTDLCPEICRMSGIEQITDSKLVGATPMKEGGWTINVESNDSTELLKVDPNEKFDALVLATHDPSVASAIIRSIVDAELDAGGFSSHENAAANNTDEHSALVMNRLGEMADSLQRVRDNEKMPVFALSLTYPKGFSQDIPFDAVSVPGSQLVQFLARDASKPGFNKNSNGDEKGETWTAITTSQMASSILSQPVLSDEEKSELVAQGVISEIAQLLASYNGGSTPEPSEVSVKRWGAAFCSKGLQLKEDSIFLAPWRLTICGDFIRDQSEYQTPLEAAALSGLEAGERTASFWTPEEQ
ncbi:hypothetical protein FRACYDRAFT_232556 [Fragilariopsis cylindrus CCMP1102]|uniref:FAD/NAD(P)-binding domain-containing protein n=1 Tax=Fragilariopsis cylindrus CCMP1102 TaxID=635003 RepID=A0A1E7FW65_9STRA|nr:hypothetical protein FRACYDRAFT_232556 [Fragilariopsis cylindrus CCMP1102]|eukprot:OEU22401.1 hypothetical protein FRACYDRAFT_232556 [Fragilariopsis cylindrus CCMP1102]